ncbi:hypothetical protein SANA_28530 [Gottschalkiaceae bacterium SANA]|nr:hypothetical protein SANA_28530 [Gottschalkiaceae bacterium SANA]
MTKINKLILHIGVHKTGTTAIQTFLYENREVLQRQGFYLPVFLYGSKPKATVLRSSIIKKRKNKTRVYLRDIVAHAKENFCDTVVISDEDYSKTNEYDLSNVKIFSEFFEQIEVLMYCRRPDRQSESGYAFCVMWEATQYNKSPEEWYRDNPGNEYYRHAMFYKQAIPACEIKVMSYDLNVNRLIPSFVESCGMQDGPYILPKKEESNISANKYMVEVMNDINQFAMSDRVFLQVKGDVVNHEKLQRGPVAIFFSEEQRSLNQSRIEEITKKFIDEFHDGQPLFEAYKPIQVPKGLDEETKEMIITGIVKKYHLKIKKTSGFIVRLKRYLKRIWERHRY